MLFSKKTNHTIEDLLEVKKNAIAQLDSHDADSEEYDKILKQIERIDKMLSHEKEGRHISPDALFAGLVSIGGILIIVSYEHLHPVISKALPFVNKVSL